MLVVSVRRLTAVAYCEIPKLTALNIREIPQFVWAVVIILVLERTSQIFGRRFPDTLFVYLNVCTYCKTILFAKYSGQTSYRNLFSKAQTFIWVIRIYSSTKLQTVLGGVNFLMEAWIPPTLLKSLSLSNSL